MRYRTDEEMVGQVTRQGKAVELICDALRLYLSLSLKVSYENLCHSLNLLRLWTSYGVSDNSFSSTLKLNNK